MKFQEIPTAIYTKLIHNCYVLSQFQAAFLAMYVMDQRRPPPSRRPPAFPTYDVKIIAGRRVVIFHDRNKDDNENAKQQQQEQEHKQSNTETSETR